MPARNRNGEKENNMDKWLITGANGFLGSRLIQYYRNQYDITGVGHKDLDITDEAAVLKYVEAMGPDRVIHCAAISNTGTCQENPELSEAVNVNGTVNLAKACKAAGARLVFMSSDQVYAGSRSMEPGKESETPDPVNVYGRHKRQAEAEVMAVLPEAVGLRLPWMYDFPVRGLKSSGGLLGNLLRALVQDRPLTLPIHDYRGITWVMEVVRHMEAAGAFPGGIYNFGGGNPLSTYDTAREVLAMLPGGEARSGLLIPDRERFAGQPRNLRMDTGRIRALGIEFPDAVSGFETCFEESISAEAALKIRAEMAKSAEKQGKSE